MDLDTLLDQIGLFLSTFDSCLYENGNDLVNRVFNFEWCLIKYCTTLNKQDN